MLTGLVVWLFCDRVRGKINGEEDCKEKECTVYVISKKFTEDNDDERHGSEEKLCVSD